MRSLLYLILAGVTHCCAAERPNVIVVLADDQGYGDMSCYGNEFLKTPSMDRLHAESSRLTSFYVSPVCSPSRASLLTGRYNQRTGVWDTYRGRCSLHPDEYTLAEALADSGYATGLFGKWHLGKHSPSLPSDQGFGMVVRDVYHPDNTRLNPTIKVNGQEEKRTGFLTDILFDEANHWIEQRAMSGEPFFALICPRLVHTSAPPQVPQEYSSRFYEMDELEEHTAEVYGMTELLDECLGRLLDQIDRLGIEENTIVVYTSDNGPQMHGGNWSESRQDRFNMGLRGAKGSVHEGGILVPFFIRWDGVLEPGRDVEGTTAHLDLMPTILDLCHVNADLPNPIDGVSVAGALLGESPLPDRQLFSQFQRAEVPSLWKNTMFRSAQHKLVNGNQLYDISIDPGETSNIASSNSGVVSDMRAQAESLFQEISNSRNYRPTPIDLVSPSGRDIRLSPISDMTSRGFAVRASRSLTLRITVSDVQPELFPEASRLALTVGGQTYREPVTPSTRVVTYEGVTLRPGTHLMSIDGDQSRKQRRWHFGLDDPGFREVVIAVD